MGRAVVVPRLGAARAPAPCELPPTSPPAPPVPAGAPPDAPPPPSPSARPGASMTEFPQARAIAAAVRKAVETTRRLVSVRNMRSSFHEGTAAPKAKASSARARRRRPDRRGRLAINGRRA